MKARTDQEHARSLSRRAESAKAKHEPPVAPETDQTRPREGAVGRMPKGSNATTGKGHRPFPVVAFG